MRTELPVDSILTSVSEALRQSSTVIVQAAPGSGKTTRVAPFLLSTYAKEGKRVVLLQPRRIAVQNVAARIAQELNSTLGQQVGYAIRFDSKYRADTQLLVATEGILRRMLSDDITLSGVSVVIFDEFHERSLDSDLLLAICRHLQKTIRPDLRIVIMSATISADWMSSKLNNVPVLRAEGKMFPVDVRYTPINPRDKLAAAVAQITSQAAQRHQGDILVFLPGKGEIHQTELQLSSSLSRDIEILPLYGTMPLEQQIYATNVNPNASASVRRRVILSTNIAETSLTIEGIRVVIDSGLARVLRYDSATGLDRLSLEPICQSSAEQRAGRAGRVASGVVYRLWSEQSQRARAAYLEPEIFRVDFASALLQLYSWGEWNIYQLPWIEAPRENTLQSACRLLEQLDAVDEGQLTDVGAEMAKQPIHPRLARLVIDGQQRGILQSAALAAAVLSERDPFITNHRQTSKTQAGRSLGGRSTGQKIISHPRRWSCDVSERLEVISEYQATGNQVTKFGDIHRNGLQTISKVAQQIVREASNGERDVSGGSESTDVELRQALLAAYPDRLARRRGVGQDRGLMVGGKGVKLSADSGVVQHEFFLCLDADAGGTDATVRLASGIERSWLEGHNIKTVDELFYSPTHKAVQCRRRTYWLDLMLEESPAPITDRASAANILAKAAIADWKRCFPHDDKELQNLIGRINLLSEHASEMGLVKITTDKLHEICESICAHSNSLEQVKSANWSSYLVGSLNSEQSAALHRLCPAKISCVSRQVSIDYTQTQPILPIKIQDAFGMRQNPRILDGKVVVQMHLLAPNMRTQQITNDLASFWQNGYPAVKKELKRRYSKHAWPDDPLNV
jgi:ATP-dependent helicase HrpB